MIPLALACIWLITANVMAMFPSRDHHWRAAYLLIAVGIHFHQVRFRAESIGFRAQGFQDIIAAVCCCRHLGAEIVIGRLVNLDP